MIGNAAIAARTWLKSPSLSLPALLIVSTVAHAQLAPVQRFAPQEYAAPPYYTPQNYYPAPSPYYAPNPGAYYAPALPNPTAGIGAQPRYYAPLPTSPPVAVNEYPPYFSPPTPIMTPTPTLPAPSARLVSQPRMPSNSQVAVEPRTDGPSFWQSMFPPAPTAVPFQSPTKDRLWVSADYLASFMRPMRFGSPLVTTGSTNDAHPGALGQPNTGVLFGNNSVDYGLLSGGKLEAGLFLDEPKRFSVQWTGFLFAPRNQTYSTASDGGGNFVVARPIFATDINDERSFINSFPGQFTGNIAVDTTTAFGGTEFNFRYHSYLSESLRLESLVGVRYLRLAESLQIRENINGINGNTLFFPPANAAYSAFSDQDSFSTTNQFIGAQLGGQVVWENRWLDASAFAKLGLGANMQRVNIDGSSTIALPNGAQTLKGGVLALSSNIGSYNRSVFALVPEFGFNVGAHLTDNIRLTFGYSILAWNRVVRPGMQYDHAVNPGLAPTGTFSPGNLTGAVNPQFRFNDEFFAINNFSFGLELRY